MDITLQAEIILRRAGYETWPWTATSPAVICFENAMTIGFIHLFESAEALLNGWRARQQTILSRHAAALRLAGGKAWNVYSIFLTDEQAPTHQRAIQRIEEDFALTRKIARTAIRTPEDIERALLPLTAVRAQPMLSKSDFEIRLRSRLKEVSPEAVTAFLGEASAAEVARILGSSS
jgi:hypothetical protein